MELQPWKRSSGHGVTSTSECKPQHAQEAGTPGAVSKVAKPEMKRGDQVWGLKESKTPQVTFQRSSRW